VDAEARFASLALVGPRNWVVGVARPAREHLWVVGRVVGTWVVPWVATVVPVRYLSRAVSMAPGVWGLPLSASVAPRAFTSLGTGG